jgi:hypothetical protein
MYDFVLKLAKILIGNAWNRAALLLLAAGVAAINGILQYIVAAVAKITIPDTPPAVGFGLVAVGVGVLVLGRLIPDRNSEFGSLGRPSIRDFGGLCRHLKPLLDDNFRVFRNFGPNSGADSLGPVRHNLVAWHELRASTIVPNNTRIRELIGSNRDLVPNQHWPAFEELVSHIDAFEAHVKNEKVDYQNNQFPRAVVEIVNRNAK